MILNPNKELFRWKVEAVPYFAQPVAYAVTMMTKKRFGCRWPKGYFTFKDYGQHCCWYSEVSDVYQEGIKAYKKFYLDKKDTKRFRREYNQDVKNLLASSRKVKKSDLKKLSAKNLENLFKTFLEKYQRFWAAGNMPESAAYGSSYLIKNAIKKEYFESAAVTLIRVLSAPEQDSFHLKQQIELLKLGQVLWQKEDLRELLLKKEIRSLQEKLSWQYPSIDKKLRDHQQKYFWILNGYYGARVLDVRYFLNDLCQHLDTKTSPEDVLEKIRSEKVKRQKEKEIVIQKYQPDRKLIRLGGIVGLTTAWQDERKSINLMANHWLDIFLNEFVRRTKIDKHELKYLIPSEVTEVLRGNRSALTKVPGRRRACAFEFSDSFRMIEEKEAKKIINRLENQKMVDFSKIKEIKGMVVSIGKKSVRGKARVLRSAKESDKLKEDEILVTVMTSPEYITAMKKARAIITDEGGLTCHAAIVSRELGKTCLVSTKIATKILENGDLVEIDTNKGIVKKL